MGRWRTAAGLIVTAAFVVAPALATPTATLGDATATPSEVHALQTQVSDLRTQVAALQTRVAEIQPTVSTPTPTASETVAGCGRPYATWGAATADGIRVHLLQVRLAADEATPAAGRQSIAIELVIENRGETPLSYRHDDFELVDCQGNTYRAGTDGPTPAVGDGELAPGASLRGWVPFAVSTGTQPATFTYHVQRPDKQGARIDCPLVDRTAPAGSSAAAAGGAGCSAFGGNG
jgi:hypothetical protein